VALRLTAKQAAGHSRHGPSRGLSNSEVIRHYGEHAPPQGIIPACLLKNEITKAIAAHTMWKKRLRSAIDNGKAGAIPVELAKTTSSFGAMAVRADN